MDRNSLVNHLKYVNVTILPTFFVLDVELAKKLQ